MALLRKEHGIEVKSASSTIEEIVARQFAERLARERQIDLPRGQLFGGGSNVRATTKKGRASKKASQEAAPLPKPKLGPPRLVKAAKAAKQALNAEAEAEAGTEVATEDATPAATSGAAPQAPAEVIEAPQPAPAEKPVVARPRVRRGLRIESESPVTVFETPTAPSQPAPVAAKPSVASPPVAAKPSVASPPVAAKPSVASPPVAAKPSVASPPVAAKPPVASPRPSQPNRPSRLRPSQPNRPPPSRSKPLRALRQASSRQRRLLHKYPRRRRHPRCSLKLQRRESSSGRDASYRPRSGCESRNRNPDHRDRPPVSAHPWPPGRLVWPRPPWVVPDRFRLNPSVRHPVAHYQRGPPSAIVHRPARIVRPDDGAPDGPRFRRRSYRRRHRPSRERSRWRKA